MFEDSLVESTGRIRTHSKRLAVGSFFLQAALVAVLALIPYLYPASLPKQALTTLLIAPPPPLAPTAVAVRAAAARSEAAPALASLSLPSHIPTHPLMNARDDNPSPPGDFVMGADGCAGANCLGLASIPTPGSGSTPPVVVAAKPKAGPTRVSAGVAAGLLLTPIRPVYPAIAKAARVHGTVVVEATISKSGDVVNAHAVSGPAMLAQAAIQAIAQAKYQPFKLNGEPVDVETTINVIFTLN